MFKTASVFLLFVSLSALAQEVTVKVLERKSHQNFSIGVGSKVELTFSRERTTKQAIFLGRMVDQNKKNIEFMFLDEQKTRILLISPENVEGLNKASTQPIIRPIDQKGSTCTAYAFLHFWDQIYMSKFKSTQQLIDVMSSDRGRMQYLEVAIEKYYINNRTNITTLIKEDGKDFGFTCKNNPFTDSKQAAEFIFQKTSEGRPVMIDFNIGGSDMVTSSYELTDYEKPLTMDRRLWIPRKVGQRTTSGHTIVAAAGFISKGKKKVLVLDSDWSEPRVWDLQRYIAQKAAVKEMGFHTCESK
jgi:hypothetical protein